MRFSFGHPAEDINYVGMGIQTTCSDRKSDIGNNGVQGDSLGISSHKRILQYALDLQIRTAQM